MSCSVCGFHDCDGSHPNVEADTWRARALAAEQTRDAVTVMLNSSDREIVRAREQRDAAEARVVALEAAAADVLALVKRIVDWTDSPSAKAAAEYLQAALAAPTAQPEQERGGAGYTDERRWEGEYAWLTGLLSGWADRYGDHLVPTGADTYGEGVRWCKSALKGMLATSAKRLADRRFKRSPAPPVSEQERGVDAWAEAAGFALTEPPESRMAYEDSAPFLPLCDDAGMVYVDALNRLKSLAGEPRWEGLRLQCTGSAHIGRAVYRCTSRFHDTPPVSSTRGEAEEIADWLEAWGRRERDHGMSDTYPLATIANAVRDGAWKAGR